MSLLITYEELKLGCLLSSLDSGIKFTNYLWGIETFINTVAWSAFARFTNYLWGIETVIEIDVTETDFEFTNYLWGIETGNAPLRLG